MNARIVTGLALACAYGLAWTPASTHSSLLTLPAAEVRGDTLRSFESEQAFLEFLRTYAPQSLGRRHGIAMDEAPMAAAQAIAPSAFADESVTNVQHAGVDEGGIVKVHGDHLIILRRGRLFTVAIGDDQLRPVSAVDAFGPDVDPWGTWYDELIVHEGVVAVVGYSYARGGTEVGLFHIDAGGRLAHRSTYQLRSHDYYSSRNYASRRIGSKLVFYTPVPYPVFGVESVDGLPAMRRWDGDGAEFRRILPASRVYHAGLPPGPGSFVLHTVTICDLARREMSCDATAVVGPHGRVFYVSPSSVYIWTSGWPDEDRDRSDPRGMLYRMPLDGSAPSALRVWGSPVDQFSFLEGDDGHLNVLVRSEAAGDGMWRAELSRGDVALMRIGPDAFSDGSRGVSASSYRPLPRPEGHTFQNRFVRDHLLYGTGSGWGRPQRGEGGAVYVVPLEGGGVTWLGLEHGVDRIEALGRDAVVVGSGGGDLHFTSVRLGAAPSLVGRHVRPEAAQGELRSHGFFYRAQDGDSGILGLPVRDAGHSGAAHLVRGSAGVLFLRNSAGRFQPLGELEASDRDFRDDACRASCVDWYGNARPLFLGGRVFALMGYEIVEGTLERDRIRELRRANFTPVRVAGPTEP